MSTISQSIPAYIFAQGIASSPILGAVTFAVDHTVNFVVQKVWPDIQSQALQFAMPVKVVVSYLAASSLHAQGSLLLSYGLYGMAKTLTNCTYAVLTPETLDKRINALGKVALLSLATSSAVFFTANAMGCPLSFSESALVAGCIAHWAARSAPEYIESKLETTIQY